MYCRYYSTTILIMGGTDQKLALWLNCVISAVNFIMTFLGLYLIEKIGRKMLLLLSNFRKIDTCAHLPRFLTFHRLFLVVIISLIILGSSFVVISAESRQRENNQTLAGNMPSDSCSQLKNCDQCSYNQSCGFCYSNQSLKLDGICITYPLLSVKLTKHGII